ncbi:hypothetical protein QQ045_021675 [Rhodiola kirilowii]
MVQFSQRAAENNWSVVSEAMEPASVDLSDRADTAAKETPVSFERDERGIGCLEDYCQSLVYYLLGKAKCYPIEGYCRRCRLLLEKVRGIDKKMQYQIRKLMGTAEDVTDATTNEKEPGETEKSEDALKYCPNPEMLISKSEDALFDSSGVYRPPHFAPAAMDEDKLSRQEKNALRKQKLINAKAI